MTGNQIAYWKYAEDVRRNAEVESQGRQSLAQGRQSLAEANRHNLATEAISRQQIGLGYSQLAETRRANQARELLQSQAQAEIERSNKVREEETNRSNVAREDEAHRHNVQDETFRVDSWNNQNKLDLEKWKVEQAGKMGVAMWNIVTNPLSGIISAGSKLIK